MKKWEYLETGEDYYNFTQWSGDTGQDMEDFISHLGTEGWELVSVAVQPGGYRVYYFKRPLK